MAAIDNAYNIDDLARLAKRRLPRGLYEFIDRGAADEVTMRANVESIKRVFFRQRVGADVSVRDSRPQAIMSGMFESIIS